MTGPVPCRSWSAHDPQAAVPPAAVVLALLAVLLSGAALVSIHHTCLDHANGDPAAIERCEDMR